MPDAQRRVAAGPKHDFMILPHKHVSHRRHETAAKVKTPDLRPRCGEGIESSKPRIARDVRVLTYAARSALAVEKTRLFAVLAVSAGPTFDRELIALRRGRARRGIRSNPA